MNPYSFFFSYRKSVGQFKRSGTDAPVSLVPLRLSQPTCLERNSPDRKKRGLKFHILMEKFLIFLAKLLSGVRVRWLDNTPVSTPRVYIANHTSHLDFLLIWSALPKKLRKMTFPVIGKDYWEKGKLRRYFVTKVFKTIFIDRKNITFQNNPLQSLLEALKKRQALILFPEGTRSRDGKMRNFKSGIYYLARKMPHIEFVPVYLKNANRVLPKGEILPVPVLCSVTFGTPFRFDTQLDKRAFLAWAKDAVEKLKNFEVI